MHLIRLIIVDESELLRVGLKASLEAGGDIEVVGDFGPTCETVAVVQRLTPDAVLLSVSWPSGDGISVCRELRGAMPSTKVVMLSRDERDEEIGQRPNVATSTVRNNITDIRSKLDLHSRAKLMANAFRHGMVDDLEDGPSMPEVAN